MSTSSMAGTELPVEAVACPFCSSTGAARIATGTDYEYDTTAREFSFVRCSACALVYLTPRPVGSALSTIYPAQYYAFDDEGTGTGFVRWGRRVWELGKVRQFTRWLAPDARRVLDVGCGRGRFLSLFADDRSRRWELHGIDLDANAIGVARTRGFEAAVSDIMSFETTLRFDLIVLQQVIEHLPDPRAALAKLWRLLAPGGVLVLETPNLAGWDFHLFQARLWGGYHFPRHFVLFTPATLCAVLRETGFEILEAGTLLSLSFWTWSLHHLLKARGWPRRLVHWSRPPNTILLTVSLVLELIQLALGRQTSNQRVVGRKPPATRDVST